MQRVRKALKQNVDLQMKFEEFGTEWVPKRRGELKIAGLIVMVARQLLIQLAHNQFTPRCTYVEGHQCIAHLRRYPHNAARSNPISNLVNQQEMTWHVHLLPLYVSIRMESIGEVVSHRMSFEFNIVSSQDD